MYKLILNKYAASEVVVETPLESVRNALADSMCLLASANHLTLNDRPSPPHMFQVKLDTTKSDCLDVAMIEYMVDTLKLYAKRGGCRAYSTHFMW